MRPRKSESIRRTAYHEAGHALILLSRNEPFVSIWVRRDLDEPLHPQVSKEMRDRVADIQDFDLAGCVNMIPGGYKTKFDWVMELTMAGIAGAWIARGEVNAPQLTKANERQDDVAWARSFGKRHGKKQTKATLQAALWRAWQRLRVYSKQHRALAETLIERGSMTYAEAVEIFEANNV
jgi:hypothetical protein